MLRPEGSPGQRAQSVLMEGEGRNSREVPCDALGAGCWSPAAGGRLEAPHTRTLGVGSGQGWGQRTPSHTETSAGRCLLSATPSGDHQSLPPGGQETPGPQGSPTSRRWPLRGLLLSCRPTPGAGLILKACRSAWCGSGLCLHRGRPHPWGSGSKCQRGGPSLSAWSQRGNQVRGRVLPTPRGGSSRLVAAPREPALHSV